MKNLCMFFSRRDAFAGAMVLLVLLCGTQAFAQSLLWNDKPDYEPGEMVTLTGYAFSAGESVTLQVLHADGTLRGWIDAHIEEALLFSRVLSQCEIQSLSSPVPGTVSGQVTANCPCPR